MTREHHHLHMPHLELPATVTITRSDAVHLFALCQTLLLANPSASTTREQRDAFGVLRKAVHG